MTPATGTADHANAPFPVLPVVHQKIRGVDLHQRPRGGNTARAFRANGADDGRNDIDTIYIGIMSGLGSTDINLTPAMVVHLANTMLTPEERAFITAPQLTGEWLSKADRAAILDPSRDHGATYAAEGES